MLKYGSANLATWRFLQTSQTIKWVSDNWSQKYLAFQKLAVWVEQITVLWIGLHQGQNNLESEYKVTHSWTNPIKSLHQLEISKLNRLAEKR